MRKPACTYMLTWKTVVFRNIIKTTTMPPHNLIITGAVAKFTCVGVIKMCTKFHAFISKCTIPVKFVLYSKRVV